MYIYFKDLIIREGTDGIPSMGIHNLFVNAGWAGKEIANWQLEKYSISLRNSTWAYTVWDKEEMIGMIRVISDQVMFANILDLIVLESHRGRGIGKELVKLCLQKLPHATWYAYTNSDNYMFYSKCGFEVKEIKESAGCAYFGYRKAREEGHR